MARFFVYAVLLWIAYFLVKKIGKHILSTSKQKDDKIVTPPAETELIRDPECGAYFLRQKGVKGVVNRQVLHFCSEACYENYLKRNSRS